jgi:MFS family permease
MQTLVEDEVRGRVSSFWGMITFGGTALGSLLVGSAATILGLQNVVIISGIACSVAAALSVFLARSRREKIGGVERRNKLRRDAEKF